MSVDLQAASAAALMLRRAVQTLTDRAETTEIGRYLVLNVSMTEDIEFLPRMHMKIVRKPQARWGIGGSLTT